MYDQTVPFIPVITNYAATPDNAVVCLTPENNTKKFETFCSKQTVCSAIMAVVPRETFSKNIKMMDDLSYYHRPSFACSLKYKTLYFAITVFKARYHRGREIYIAVIACLCYACLMTVGITVFFYIFLVASLFWDAGMVYYRKCAANAMCDREEYIYEEHRLKRA